MYRQLGLAGATLRGSLSSFCLAARRWVLWLPVVGVSRGSYLLFGAALLAYGVGWFVAYALSPGLVANRWALQVRY